jgi:hypothetical protein
VNAIQKPLFGLKNFKGFGSGFAELHTKLDAARCSILPSIANKTKLEVERELV